MQFGSFSFHPGIFCLDMYSDEQCAASESTDPKVIRVSWSREGMLSVIFQGQNCCVCIFSISVNICIHFNSQFPMPIDISNR